MNLGESIVSEAKKYREAKKKSCESDLHRACYEGAFFYTKRPITVSGVKNRIKNIKLRQIKESECFICGEKILTCYINNGKRYCTKHKDLAHLSITKQEQIKKEEGAKHVN